MSDIPPQDSLYTGFNEFIGLKIAAWEENKAEIFLDLEPHHLNRSGTLHGGLIGTLLDAACGLAGCFCNQPGNVRKAVSLNLSTNFMGQISEGRVVAKSTVRKGGYKIFFADAELVSETGDLLATAHGTYRYRKGSETLAGQPVS